MKAYRVEFTPNARQDMLDYARYIRSQEGSDRYALEWYEGMHAAVMNLRTMPRRCAVAREVAAFDLDLRQLVYQSHRVLFSIHDEDQLVVIHRVWHCARDDATAEDLT